MRKTRKLAIALLVFLPAVVSIVWCSYTSYTLITAQCDIEGYLKDPKTKEELSVALRNFERQHNLAFDDHYLMNTTCSASSVEVPLDYNTPLNFSKYGIIYNLSLSARYSVESREVTLQMLPEYPTTQDVLTYIRSLKNEIAALETTPQMDEFVNQFKQKGVKIDATVHGGFLWVDADRWAELPKGCCGISKRSTLSGELTYSTTKHSIDSYTLPNRITWRAFPEIPVIHELINEQLLVNGLATCVISTEEKTSAYTAVDLLPGPSISAHVRLVCGDTAEEKYLRLILHPDGSYESEFVE
jgi:hypothetical protein